MLEFKDGWFVIIVLLFKLLVFRGVFWKLFNILLLIFLRRDVKSYGCKF